MLSSSSKTRIFIFLFLFCLDGYAQDKTSKDTTRVVICQYKLAYPPAAEENNISGTVVILFDIDSNCKVINTRIEKGLGYGCDEEAVKALKKCKPVFEGARRKCTPFFNLRQPFTFKNYEDE